MTMIVWNGCDGYVEADVAVRLGYDFDGEKLYTQLGAFAAFDVQEIHLENLPINADGERDLNGVFATETGKIYRQACPD